MSYLRPPSPYETTPAKTRPLRAADDEPTGANLRLGRVISRAFTSIGRRWRPLGFFVLAYLAVEWADQAFVRLRYHAGQHDAALAAGVALYLGFSLLLWFRDTALTATVLQASSAKASILQALADAVRAFPTLAPFFIFANLPSVGQALWRDWFGVHRSVSDALSYALWSGLGEVAFALVVTGCFGVVVPVVVGERQDLVASLRRAWGLLAGSRWRLLVLFVVVMVLAATPSLIATLSYARLGPEARPFLRTELAVAGWIGSVLFSTWQVFVSAAYMELVRNERGALDDEIVQVFA
jgi:hypothetical protein